MWCCRSFAAKSFSAAAAYWNSGFISTFTVKASSQAAPEGVAASMNAKFLQYSQVVPGFLDLNLANITEVAKLQYDGTSELLLKPTGNLNHGGGHVIDEGSEQYKILAQMVERASGDGGWIREYVSPQGIVFAVSWNTRFKPRLDTLLGRYQAGYAAAASQALARPGRAAVQRQATLRADDLVVQSSGFLNTFHGRAWAPSLVPAGFDAATLR